LFPFSWRTFGPYHKTKTYDKNLRSYSGGTDRGEAIPCGKESKMKASLRAACLFLLPFILFLNSCEKGSTKPAAEEKAYNVQVQAAEKKSLRPFVEAIGTLYPYDEVTVSTEVDGILSDLKAEDGTRVSKGMLLALIDDTDYLLEVKRAESTAAGDRRPSPGDPGGQGRGGPDPG
jgi:hypothetical protein